MISQDFIKNNKNEIIRMTYSFSILFSLMIGLNIGLQSFKQEYNKMEQKNNELNQIIVDLNKKLQKNIDDLKNVCEQEKALEKQKANNHATQAFDEYIKLCQQHKCESK